MPKALACLGFNNCGLVVQFGRTVVTEIIIGLRTASRRSSDHSGLGRHDDRAKCVKVYLVGFSGFKYFHAPGPPSLKGF